MAAEADDLMFALIRGRPAQPGGALQRSTLITSPPWPSGLAMERGRFITIEGGEGVGKSTQITALRAALESSGLEVVTTREPGGTPLAERIRQLLLQPGDEKMPATSELLLLFAARAMHLANVIEPALERGAWVICDRFIDSTYAYQGGGRGMDVAQIAALEQMVLKDARPDLTLLLDVSLEISEQRVTKRAIAADRMEQEKRDFFERVRGMYLLRAQMEPNRVHVVDAGGSVDEVRRAMWNVVERLMTRDKELGLTL